MRNLLVMLGVGVALAGCKESPSTLESAAKTGEIRLTNASTEEVLKQVNAAKDKNKIEPGEWENSYQIVSIEMPGAPEEMKKQIEADLKSPPMTSKECKTDASVKALDLAELGPQAQNCTFAKYVMAAGKIEATMECKSGESIERLEMNGTQSSTAFDYTLTQTKPTKDGDNKMAIRSSGKRIGACKA